MFRELRDGDVYEMYRLFTEMYEEFKENLCVPDYKKAMDMLYGCVVWVTVDEKDMPQGVLAVRKGTLWYTQQEVVADIVFFIRKEFRKGRRAAELLECAKQYGKALKLPLYMGTTSGHDPDGLVKLYERAGFKTIGNRFIFKD